MSDETCRIKIILYYIHRHMYLLRIIVIFVCQQNLFKYKLDLLEKKLKLLSSTNSWPKHMLIQLSPQYDIHFYHILYEEKKKKVINVACSVFDESFTNKLIWCKKKYSSELKLLNS